LGEEELDGNYREKELWKKLWTYGKTDYIMNENNYFKIKAVK
jgi:hypothetical protein